MGTKNSSRFTPLIIAISVVAGILIGTFYAKHFAGNRLGIINGSSNKLNALLRVVDDQYVDSVNMTDLVEKAMPQILAVFSDCVLSQKNIADKMKLIRQKLKGADVLDEFDRVVFESIVEKVVVGDMEEDGTADPYKLTFVLKGMDDRSIPYARDRYMNLCEKAV